MTSEERICTVDMAPDLIIQWTGTATGSANKDVRDILARSPSKISFFPSEAKKLCASAQRCLPGYNDLTMIDVSAKFVARIAAFGPPDAMPAPHAEPPAEPDGQDEGPTGTEDEDEAP